LLVLPEFLERVVEAVETLADCAELEAEYTRKVGLRDGVFTEEDFKRIEASGIPRASIIARVGKLFLDFGFHAPTVAFPEVFGLMIEPTESYTKDELDRFAEVVLAIGDLIRTNPEVLRSTPRFTPVDRVDEVAANRNLVLSERLTALPLINENRLSPVLLNAMPVAEIKRRVLATV
jgi:glycine dehydrogenase